MKVAYVFKSPLSAVFQLGEMVLPQLERGTHGARVVGMFFFDDNIYSLRAGEAVGERLARVAAAQNILLMICDACAVRRDMATGDFAQCGSGEVQAKGCVAGVVAGCFPQLYEALSAAPPDQVITL